MVTSDQQSIGHMQLEDQVGVLVDNWLNDAPESYRLLHEAILVVHIVVGGNQRIRFQN